MKTLTISLIFSSTSNFELPYTIKINDSVVFSGHTDKQENTIEFLYDPENVTRHKFAIELSGKQNLLDTVNDIDLAVETCVKLEQLKFNNVDIIPIIRLSGKYQHGDTQEEFCEVLGFDGIMSFDFTTPIDHWVISEYPF